MSRTYRRKKGYRWWANTAPSMEFVRVAIGVDFHVWCYRPVSPEPYKKNKTHRYERDIGHWNGKHHLKWYLNNNRRAKQRQQLSLILAEKQEHYDITYEESAERIAVQSWW